MSTKRTYESLQGSSLFSMKNGNKNSLTHECLQVLGGSEVDAKNSAVIYTLSDGQTQAKCAFVEIAKKKVESSPLKDLSLVCANVTLKNNLVFFISDYAIIDSAFDKKLGDPEDISKFSSQNAPNPIVISLGQSYNIEVAGLVAYAENNNGAVNIEDSLNDMKKKISLFEKNLKSKLTEFKDYVDTPNSNPSEVKGFDNASNLDLANVLLEDIKPERVSLHMELIRYFETKEMLKYMAQKDMIDYLEKRDALELLAKKDMLNYMQARDSGDDKLEGALNKDLSEQNDEIIPRKRLESINSQNNKLDTANINITKNPNQKIKLIMPFMHAKVDSFENLGENPKHEKYKNDLFAFKASVKSHAKKNADIE